MVKKVASGAGLSDCLLAANEFSDPAPCAPNPNTASNKMEVNAAPHLYPYEWTPHVARFDTEQVLTKCLLIPRLF